VDLNCQDKKEVDVDVESASLCSITEVLVAGALLYLALGQPEKDSRFLAERTRRTGAKMYLTEARPGETGHRLHYRPCRVRRLRESFLALTEVQSVLSTN
jgi:hypothetical protein